MCRLYSTKSSIADGARVGAHCVLKDVRVGAGTTIAPFSHIEGAVIGERCRVGPFARIRPGTDLDDEVHVGNFVEVKASRMGKASKANHLAYVGDSTVGRQVNIGAGTITCNYDGQKKSPTLIGDGAFVGSNSTLVAPVEIGAGSYVAAGSVITKQVPEDALGIGRGRQENKEGWAKLRREKKKS